MEPAGRGGGPCAAPDGEPSWLARPTLLRASPCKLDAGGAVELAGVVWALLLVPALLLLWASVSGFELWPNTLGAVTTGGGSSPASREVQESLVTSGRLMVMRSTRATLRWMQRALPCGCTSIS